MIRIRLPLLLPGLLILVLTLLLAWLIPWTSNHVLATWIDYSTGAQQPASATEFMFSVIVPLALAASLLLGMSLCVWGLFTRKGAAWLLVIWLLLFAVYLTGIWASGSTMILGAWDMRLWPYMLWPLLAGGVAAIGFYWMTEPCLRRDIEMLVLSLLVAGVSNIGAAWTTTDERFDSLYQLMGIFASTFSMLIYPAAASLVVNFIANIWREFSARSCVEDSLDTQH